MTHALHDELGAVPECQTEGREQHKEEGGEAEADGDSRLDAGHFRQLQRVNA